MCAQATSVVVENVGGKKFSAPRRQDLGQLRQLVRAHFSQHPQELHSSLPKSVRGPQSVQAPVAGVQRSQAHLAEDVHACTVACQVSKEPGATVCACSNLSAPSKSAPKLMPSKKERNSGSKYGAGSASGCSACSRRDVSLSRM